MIHGNYMKIIVIDFWGPVQGRVRQDFQISGGSPLSGS